MKTKLFLFIISLLIISCSSSSDDSPENPNNDTGMMIEADLFEGSFVSDAHPTSGKAIVNEDQTILSFTDFKQIQDLCLKSI